MTTSQELRKKYIEFFKAKGHAEIPSASLIPENDPSVLFTTAGMHPLVPFLLGEKHPAGNLLVNSQKCIRTGDIDEVGDKTHHTFFEMLGHWSLGDYFKSEAIEMTFEFITKELKLEKDKLAVSVFAGDENAEFDSESFDKWIELGISENRIAKLGKKDNWWETGGSSGPCGPDTEMFYWTGDEKNIPDEFNPEDKKWVEIGNDVLMQYEKKEKPLSRGVLAETRKPAGEDSSSERFYYVPAKQKNIDNGTGLERLLAVMNGLDDNYKTDLFLPIIEKIEELSGKKYFIDELPEASSPNDKMSRRGRLDERDGVTRSMRIIADHLRSATFIMGDEKGIAPSNVDQGYVVRKLIRRAIRHGKLIGINEIFCHKISQVVIDLMSDIYPELQNNKDFIINQITKEEEKFLQTLEQGLKEFEKMIKRNPKGSKIISGVEAFNLFQTYGFPLELTQEMAREKGLDVDVDGFNHHYKKHQDLSRTASAGKFKGGLADNSEQTIKYHTTAHLLMQALRQVLGDHVEQRGSNITEERLRLDFSHSEKMTDEQKSEVEKIVNEQIQKNLPVTAEEMTLEEAKAQNAMGVFENKYGNKVKVYSVGEFSKEICGGPHVSNTSELGNFKIKKEQSSSGGVRRIKAILENF